MTAITKAVEAKLDSFTSAAHSGQLGSRVSQFLLQSVNAVYSAPGNFRNTQALLDHLATLEYLIDCHVYRR